MDNAVHVHIRDASKGKLQAHFGEGTVDFDWMFSELKRRGYKGHFSIEYLESDGMDILEDVVKLKNKIAEYFEE